MVDSLNNELEDVSCLGSNSKILVWINSKVANHCAYQYIWSWGQIVSKWQPFYQVFRKHFQVKVATSEGSAYLKLFFFFKENCQITRNIYRMFRLFLYLVYSFISDFPLPFCCFPSVLAWWCFFPKE